MNNYWAGVFVGFMCALLLMGVACVGVINRMTQYEKALEKLNEHQEQLEEMYAEHEKIMKAYEFYNWKMGFKDD